MKYLLSVLAGASLLLLAGCMSGSGSSKVVTRPGPVFTPHNYVGDTRLPGSIHRVLLLPVHGGEVAPPEASESLDPTMVTELEGQMRFEVVTLPREECMKLYGVPDISSAAVLPHDFLQSLGRKYSAQAVMFVDVTAYQAYRPLTLGLRMKLASVADHRLIWSLDEVFSTSNPAVVTGLRRYYQHNDMGDLPFDMTSNDLQSPTRFAAYIADMAFRTLPPR